MRAKSIYYGRTCLIVTFSPALNANVCVHSCLVLSDNSSGISLALEYPCSFDDELLDFGFLHDFSVLAIFVC